MELVQPPCRPGKPSSRASLIFSSGEDVVLEDRQVQTPVPARSDISWASPVDDDVHALAAVVAPDRFGEVRLTDVEHLDALGGDGLDVLQELCV